MQVGDRDYDDLIVMLRDMIDDAIGKSGDQAPTGVATEFLIRIGELPDSRDSTKYLSSKFDPKARPL